MLGSESFVEDVLLPFYRQTKAAMSVFTASVMLKSLESLPFCMAAHSETVAKIAEWLFKRPNI